MKKTFLFLSLMLALALLSGCTKEKKLSLDGTRWYYVTTDGKDYTLTLTQDNLVSLDINFPDLPPQTIVSPFTYSKNRQTVYFTDLSWTEGGSSFAFLSAISGANVHSMLVDVKETTHSTETTFRWIFKKE